MLINWSSYSWSDAAAKPLDDIQVIKAEIKGVSSEVHDDGYF
jgi:hypothetical protein